MAMLSKKLEGRVSIVTGSGRGNGKAFALGLAREGSKVACVVNKHIDEAEAVAEEIRKLGSEAIAIKADVSNPDQTKEMAKKTAEHFGKIDILVNNAAIYPMKPWHMISWEEWNRVLSVNLGGYFLCCQAVYPYMKKHGYGKIINISSGQVLMGTPGYLHYVASKGGIIAMTRSLSREVGDDGIRVNCITLGFVPGTEGVQELISEQRDAMKNLMNMVMAMQAIHRQQEPEDAVGAVIFLASPDSDAITGQTLNVDLGLANH